MALLSGELGGPFPPLNNGTTYYLDEQRQALIQTVYKKFGYLTAQMEDEVIYGTLARIGDIGFKQDPTNIYYRGPFLAMDQMGMLNTLLGTLYFRQYSSLLEEHLMFLSILAFICF